MGRLMMAVAEPGLYCLVIFVRLAKKVLRSIVGVD